MLHRSKENVFVDIRMYAHMHISYAYAGFAGMGNRRLQLGHEDGPHREEQYDVDWHDSADAVAVLDAFGEDRGTCTSRRRPRRVDDPSSL